MRVREGAALQRSRPVDLPVPTGDEADLEQVSEEGLPLQEVPGRSAATEVVGERTGKGRGNEGGKGERFSTPASWRDGRPQVHPGSGPLEKGQNPPRTEGEMPQDDGDLSIQGGSMEDHDGLQRAFRKGDGGKAAP